MLYVGLDIHARTFTMAALNARGEIVFETRRETSCESLQETVGALAAPRWVVLEESTLASWAYRELLGHADRVVVAEPWHNRLIGEDEKLDDQAAARKLARLLRSDDIRPVYHTDQVERQVFKELVLLHGDVVKQTTRCKNRLTAKFQQHGVRAGGRELYRADRREAWRAKLPSDGSRYQVDLLWEALDHAEDQRSRLRNRLRRQARAFEPIRRFVELPGVGWIRAATFYAIVDTPHRFASRSKLWSYCGIGLAKRTSGQSSKPAHLTRRGNPQLKSVAKGAAISAIAAGDNPFAVRYRRLTAEGTSPQKARLTVARSIVSALWTMWRQGTTYCPRRKADPLPWPIPSSGRSID